MQENDRAPDCVSVVVILWAKLLTAQIPVKEFILTFLFVCLSCSKTNDAAFATFTPFTFLLLAYARATLANWSPGKVLPVREKPYFSIFVERISQKPPSVASKVPRLLV